MLTKYIGKAGPSPQDFLHRDFIEALKMSLICIPASYIHIIWRQWDEFKKIKLEENKSNSLKKSEEAAKDDFIGDQWKR